MLTVLAASLNLAAYADDVFLAGRDIVLQITVMFVVIGCRHQHFDAVSDHFRRLIAKETLARLVVDADGALFVDDHDAVDGRGDESVKEGIVLRAAPRSLTNSRHDHGP